MRVTFLPAVLMLVCAAVGCHSDTDMPHDRLGALPYPGLLTLYRTADPNHLGNHSYSGASRADHEGETSGGILYTTRAGFLDLAHIRITIDTVRYCVVHLRAAIARGDNVVRFTTLEGSQFVARLNYPSEWTHAPADSAERDLADELTLRAGQRIAYEMMVWHELATWFGYRTFPLADEQPSAFSYDDTMSHVVGLRVAEVALRGSTDDRFDESVTFALRYELKRLGAVSPAETNAAAAAVDGYWWHSGHPLRRQLDVGLSDGVVHPWLITAVTQNSEETPRTFHLPTLKDVDGRDFSGFLSVAIDPRILAAHAMRAQLPGHPDLIDADRDFPVLISRVRSEMQAQWGMQVDSPVPSPTSPALAIRAGKPLDPRVAGTRNAHAERLPSTRPHQG